MNVKTENQSTMTPEEKWENATIANNFIFYKVMRSNPDVCKRLLEILLETEIDKIDIHQEEEIDVDYASKGVDWMFMLKTQRRHLMWKCSPPTQKNSLNVPVIIRALLTSIA